MTRTPPTVSVQDGSIVRIGVGVGWEYLAAHEARALARMLCAAADAIDGKPWPEQPRPASTIVAPASATLLADLAEAAGSV